MERDQELIDGFLSRNPAAETRFVVEFQKWTRAEVRRFAPKLWRELDDIEQSTLLKICEMREKPELAALIRPPIKVLVRDLLAGPLRKEKRVKHWPRFLESEEPAVAPNQEQAVMLRELDEIAMSLPRGMAGTMLAQEAYESGDGPPLAEALGTDARSARRRLARAQEAVIRIAEGENVELPKEDSDE